MRSVLVAVSCFLLAAGAASAQTDRGTITGTVADQAGALIPGAAIEAKNLNTGAVHRVTSTSTGNYTLAQLPPGTYQLSSSISGFKQFTRTGITVLAMQVLRIDIALQVGDITETVTVNADATLLRTESGEMSHNVSGSSLNSLPLLGFSAAVRDPYSMTQLVPGALYSQTSVVRIGGAVANTEGFRIEGQDSSNSMRSSETSQNQPSVDAIEEMAVLTSNYAAEYGQAGGGFINITMKSGTNKLHGSAYDYWTNEALNANKPFLNTKDRQRRNNYGFSLGGPVYIPHVYNGREKTFFFFSLEQYRENVMASTNLYTVPTLAYRSGDFRLAIPPNARVLGKDPLGRDIIEGTIYDPATDRLAPNGQRVRDPFLNNTIPKDRFDPVAVKIQDLIPLPKGPTKDDIVSNYLEPFKSSQNRSIPSVKIDHNFSSRSKISGFWSLTTLEGLNNPPFCDGFATAVSSCRNSIGRSHTVRLNFDQTLAPTMLLHLGAGLHTLVWKDDANIIDFDQLKELGLKGASVTIFPYITFPQSQPRGGMKSMGPLMQSHELMLKPTANASLTWVKSNHTYKFGAEMRLEGFPTDVFIPAYGVYNFTNAQTGLAIDGLNLRGGTIGFPYANFLLGLVNDGNIGVVTTPRMGKSAWALFAQDSWKVTRRFTLDYGLRWDYQGYLREQYGRIPNFSPTTANPATGNLPGAVIFEKSGPGRCNCNFASVYPYAFGPRLGVSYQITSKTVLRAGAGITYSTTATENRMSPTIASNNPFFSRATGDEAITLQNGPPTPAPWPYLNPGQYPMNGIPGVGPSAFDRGAGRPPRMIQWSIGIQREISKDLAVEVSYVGNRGAYWEGNDLINVNAMTPEILSKAGLDINKAADISLLKSPMSSAAASGRINPATGKAFSALPYATFPTSQTVAQSLRPFPQFTTITYMWAPLGRTWYDSMQLKITKRFSHGLDASSSFSWQKELMMGAEATNERSRTPVPVNNVFNRSANKYLSRMSRPFVWVTALNYTTPKLGGNKVLSWVTRDWRIGAVLNYSSGMPIQVPAAQTTINSYLFQTTYANRVPGQPLWKPGVNINDTSTYNPFSDFVLNPAAWIDPPEGQFSSSAAYYSDYRYQRRPVESMSIGRIFRIKEGVNLNIRADFQNALNRLVIGNPTATNAKATQTINPVTGETQSGFGDINTNTGLSPRQGVIVARIQF